MPPVRRLGLRDPSIHESHLAGVRQGHLAELMVATERIGSIEEATLAVSVDHPTYEEWWRPFSGGVGPAGAYVASQDGERREAPRARCLAALPTEPFTITARAWAARGTVIGGSAGCRRGTGDRGPDASSVRRARRVVRQAPGAR